MNKKTLVLAAAAFAAAPFVANAQTTINFDSPAAPCTFNQTTPLTTQYSAQGVTFNGSGSVLDQCGNFGVSARTGTQFYAFNTMIQSLGPVISFTNPVNTFDIFASGGGSAAAFTLTAFDASHNTLGTFVGNSSSGAYTELMFNGSGISSVSISTSANSYVFDDLKFSGAATTTPEPGSLALLGTGIAGLVPMLRRKRA